MNEIFEGARQAANLIGGALANGNEAFIANMQRAQRLIVLADTKPTEDEKAQFDKLLKNKTIKLDKYGVMIRVNKNISINVNLRSGYYGFGQGRLEGAILYQARQLGGWEDPTGEHPPKEQ